MKPDNTDTTNAEPVNATKPVFYDKRGIEVVPASVRVGDAVTPFNEWLIKQVTG